MFVPDTLSRPPADMAIPYGEQVLFTALTQIPFVFTAIIAIRNLVQKSDPTCLLFAIGGVIASVFEPFVDVFGFCYFPREGNFIAFEWAGRPIPVFVPATYGWFVGGVGYWYWTQFKDPKTTEKDVWKMWFRSWIFNLCLEYPALYWGIYTYYGYQPFAIGGFPLWFPAIHATSPILAASITNLMDPHMKGWEKLSILAIVPCAYGMANAGFGWPVWIALTSDVGYHVSYPMGFVTVGLLTTGLWIMSKQFAVPKSVKLQGSEKS